MDGKKREKTVTDRMYDSLYGGNTTVADKVYNSIYGKGGALDRIKSGEKVDFGDAMKAAIPADCASEQLKKKKSRR